jgi:UDP-perosamine 4-acetyltransferase
VAGPPHLPDAGAPILGDDAALPQLLARGITHAFVAVGANDARLRLAAIVDGLGFVQPAIVSRGAELAPTSTVGSGTIIMTSAVVHPNATIGRYCVVNTGAIVEHGCRIGDGAHIAPGSVLCGDVTVGRGCLIGAGA